VTAGVRTLGSSIGSTGLAPDRFLVRLLRRSVGAALAQVEPLVRLSVVGRHDPLVHALTGTDRARLSAWRGAAEVRLLAEVPCPVEDEAREGTALGDERGLGGVQLVQGQRGES
jgi:hypothetical protein